MYKIYSYHIADETQDTATNQLHGSARDDESAYNFVQQICCQLSSDERVYATDSRANRIIYSNNGYREC